MHVNKWNARIPDHDLDEAVEIIDSIEPVGGWDVSRRNEANAHAFVEKHRRKP
jgi:hypothetical protein